MDKVKYMKIIVFFCIVSTQLIFSSELIPTLKKEELRNVSNVKKEILERELKQSDVFLSFIDTRDNAFIDRHNCSYTVQTEKVSFTISSRFGNQNVESISCFLIRCDGKQSLPCKIIDDSKKTLCMSELLTNNELLNAVLHIRKISIKNDQGSSFFAFKLKYIDEVSRSKILEIMRNSSCATPSDDMYGFFL